MYITLYFFFFWNQYTKFILKSLFQCLEYLLSCFYLFYGIRVLPWSYFCGPPMFSTPISSLKKNDPFHSSSNDSSLNPSTLDFIHSSDVFFSVSITRVLDGTNYQSWSRAFRMTLMSVHMQIIRYLSNKNEDEFTTLVIYVDDIVLIGNSAVEMAQIKHVFHSNFWVKDLRALRYFLVLINKSLYWWHKYHNKYHNINIVLSYLLILECWVANLVQHKQFIVVASSWF